MKKFLELINKNQKLFDLEKTTQDFCEKFEKECFVLKSITVINLAIVLTNKNSIIDPLEDFRFGEQKFHFFVVKTNDEFVVYGRGDFDGLGYLISFKTEKELFSYMLDFIKDINPVNSISQLQSKIEVMQSEVNKISELLKTTKDEKDLCKSKYDKLNSKFDQLKKFNNNIESEKKILIELVNKKRPLNINSLKSKDKLIDLLSEIPLYDKRSSKFHHWTKKVYLIEIFDGKIFTFIPVFTYYDGDNDIPAYSGFQGSFQVYYLKGNKFIEVFLEDFTVIDSLVRNSELTNRLEFNLFKDKAFLERGSVRQLNLNRFK